MIKAVNGRIPNPHQHFLQTVEAPDSLYLQFRDVDTLFRVGVCSKNKNDELLYKILKAHFPISNINGSMQLHFVNYVVEPPKYSPDECLQLGISYAVSLIVKFRLVIYDKEDVLEQDVYFGEVPYVTPRGSYIYNGIERVCVTQLQKTNGISFVSTNKNHDITDYVCKIIPKKGSWIEIFVGGKKLIYICFNKTVKILLSDYLKIFGFETQKEIYDIFDLVEEIDCTKKALSGYVGRVLAENVYDNTKNGEAKQKKIVFHAYTAITEHNIDMLSQLKKKVLVFKCDSDKMDYYKTFIDTVINTSTEDVASLSLSAYFLFNPAYNGKDSGMALKYVRGVVSDDKLYSVEGIARKSINSVVGCEPEDQNNNVLSKSDFKHIISHFMDVVNGVKTVDNIDHYGNKCLFSPEKQLYDQLYMSFYRISRAAKERLNICEKDGINIYNLINVGVFSSTINQFFATNSFVQFMDELNPLSEVIHKRRVSTVGVGGITAESKAVDVRDIHYSQYGKICPVETPEGINIGLVSALASYAKCDDCGVMVTPYRVVRNGVVDLNDENIVYLNANHDVYKYIAPANIHYNKDGFITDEQVEVRYLDTFTKVSREKVDLVDVATNQAFSIGTSLIPFLENIEASRALMGTNMQRQAVPLIKPQVPIVGTGYERKICTDCRDFFRAEHDGVVAYADAQKIIIDYELSDDEILCSYEEKRKEYDVLKFRKTNQKTCRNYRPIVKKGDKVKKGDFLVDGFASVNGELALGVNLKVAFLAYKGYNYEDAIVISDRVLKEDLFTSIYLETYETSTHKTKLCDEEFTNDLCRMTEHDKCNLNDRGLVKEGAFVKDGDILVGKVVPNMKNSGSPEAKLLREIFNGSTYDMNEEPLTMPPFSQGVVVDSKILKRKSHSSGALSKVGKKVELLQKKYLKMLESFREEAIAKFVKLLDGKKSNLILQEYGEVVMKEGDVFSEDVIRNKIFYVEQCTKEEHIVLKYKLFLENIYMEDWTKDPNINSLVELLIKNTLKMLYKIRSASFKEYHQEWFGDYLESDVLSKAEVTIAHKRKLQVGDKLSGRHGNKGVVSKIARVEDMPFMEDGTPVDLVLTPLGIISRMAEGQVYDALLGLVGEKLGCRFISPVFSGFDVASIQEQLENASLPRLGEVQLYDGFSGEKFNQTCTVGDLYFIKLNHMVDDKVHARSVGKYSMISQQPLSGRAYFGGQRLGEMEVWSLEAYGAAYLLHEMITVKSDDVLGRKSMYESIVAGDMFSEWDVPESFKVLLQELRGVGLNFVFE
ncbi:MAG: DNA-directed RNA polymerase subunit beta [Cytophagales bacterium]|nr:DNA-directed RNA polymerase subunit beta [Cytophagales bacterium]